MLAVHKESIVIPAKSARKACILSAQASFIFFKKDLKTGGFGKMQTSGLRKKQKKELLEKITALVGRKLYYLNSVDGWTYLEISEATGIPNNRISEYVHFEKHQRSLTEEHLSLFIGGGIVEVEDLKKTLELNEAERDYLETLTVYEDKKLKEYAMLLKKDGFDPGEILKRAWESKEGKESV